ncbi:hypothetical protein QZM68_28405 [Burkholderia gladioli]|uniref:hypothetical protein n=1 Tax=Burkholderia gladioli TaxID=28095 RepID=UPI00264F38D7|nr:hypothetical protein [Burkholderia gladioli]MDN7603686.1 hypothetical protein [Burkholderia gladioli]
MTEHQSTGCKRAPLAAKGRWLPKRNIRTRRLPRPGRRLTILFRLGQIFDAVDPIPHSRLTRFDQSMLFVPLKAFIDTPRRLAACEALTQELEERMYSPPFVDEVQPA